MTTREAIEALDRMQSQIIHGSRVFANIADALRLQQSRAAAWSDYAVHQEHCAACAEAVNDCHEGTELKARAEELEQQAA